MSSSITKRSSRVSAGFAAGVILLGLISPVGAAGAQDAGALTSHSPWLAPVGHRQPTRDDVPQNEMLSAWERQQQVLDAELDRKLTICRGC
jgi:hypothetical protein